MEFTSDLVGIQGLLTSVNKIAGPFVNLRYRGGNEERLNTIINEVEGYLTSKSYIKNKKINIKFEKNVEDILFYAVVNTEFEDLSYKNDEEISHFINTVPQLSKCILVHIILELGLSEVCPKVFLNSPLKVLLEITDELISCIKRAPPEETLQPTINFLKTIVLRLSLLENDRQNEEIIEKLTDVGIELVRKLGLISPEFIQGWKTEKIFRHMGSTFINLLNLLQMCNERDAHLVTFIDGIISASISILKAVTIDVFCVWAEITYEGQPLQTAIASESYRVIEKYKAYKPASEFVQMLSSIARKPKTLSEVILEADTETMISCIENSNSNPDIQRQWFVALLNTNVFSNEEATECLNKYSHLCTEEDASRVLNMSINKNLNTRQIAFKCVQHFNSSSLNLIMTRFFYRNGVNTHLRISDNIKEELIKLLNNMKKGQRDPVKEIQLLLLQDPCDVLRILIEECLKKLVYVQCLKEVFKCIKSVAEIDSLWLKLFLEVFASLKPSWENLSSYVTFINALIELEYILFAKLAEEVLVPAINNCVTNEDFEEHLIVLHMLYDIDSIDGKSVKLLTVLLNSLNKTRCKFLEFSYIKQECSKKIVEILNKIGNSAKTTMEMIKIENLGKLNRFYLESLISKEEVRFLKFMIPNIETLQYGDLVGRLIQFLPQCVETEWLSVFEELASVHGKEKAFETLTDFALLLSQLVESQTDKQSELHKRSINGLKYCITHYGIVMKKFLLSENNVDIEKVGAKSVCYLLKHIPDEIKEEEGLKLAGILTDQALQQLANDESFVYSLAAIRNTKISQIIAKRMLA